MHAIAGRLMAMLLACCWAMATHATTGRFPWPPSHAEAAPVHSHIIGLMQAGKYAEAEQAWMAAAQRFSGGGQDQAAFLIGLSQQQRLMAKFQASLQTLRQCQSQFLSTENGAPLIRAHLASGYADLAIEQLQPGARAATLRACQAAFESLPPAATMRSVLAFKIAYLHRLLKQPDQAKEWLTLAQSQPQGSCADSLRIQNELAYSLVKEKLPQEALAALKRLHPAMAACPSLMPEDRILHLYYLSECYKAFAEADPTDLRSAELADSALGATMEIGEQFPEIRTNFLYISQISLAMHLFETGDINQAEKIAKQALAGQKARNVNPKMICEAYSCLGHFYHYLGQTEDALAYYEQARINYPKDQQAGNTHYVTHLHNHAQELINNLEFEKGYHLMEEARTLLEEMEAKEYGQLAMLDQNIGIGEYLRKQYAQATGHLQEALANHLRAKDVDWYSTCYVRIYLAICLEATGNHEAAEKEKNTCQQDLSRIPLDRPMERAMVLEMMTDYYRLSHRMEEALEINHRFMKEMIGPALNPDRTSCPDLDRSVSPWHTLFAASQKASILWGLYEETDSLAYLKASLACSQKALTRLRKLRQEQNNEQEKLRINREWNTLFDYAMRAALELYSKTQEVAHLHTAFEISEQSKAMVLMEAVLANRVLERNAGNAPLVDEQQKIRARIFHLKAALNAVDNQPAKISELRHELWAYEQRLHEIMDQIQAANPRYSQIVNAFDVVTVRALQPILRRDNRAVVEYFWTDSTIVAFVVTADTFLVHSIFQSHAFNQVLDSFARSLHTLPTAAEGEARQYHRQSKSILNAIWTPFAHHLPKRVTIIPDGRLNLISFEALADTLHERSKVKFSDLGYLLEHFVISYNYSGTFLAQQVPDGSQRAATILGIAPVFAPNSGLSPLPTSKEGIQKLAKTYKDATALVDVAATKKAFLELASQFAIVDLATHGSYDRKNFMNSRIYFSPDGSGDSLLSITDVYTHNLPLQLAILEACETGLGDYHQGEGVMSMARAFTFAGCKSVLMSLWEVAEGNSTQSILEGFYANLADSMPLDEAVAKAKLDYLTQVRSEGGYHLNKMHPFYWSELVLIGNHGPLPIQRADSDRRWMWMTGGGLMIAGGFGFWFWSRRKAGKSSSSS